MKRPWIFIAALLLSPAVKADVLSINQFGGLNTDHLDIYLTNGQTPDSLNVVTDEGLGLSIRKGWSTFSTETAKQIWEFPLGTTRYMIAASTTGVLKAGIPTKNVSGVETLNLTITISTIPTNRDLATAILGGRFYFADDINGLKYWMGASVVLSSAAMKVDKLASYKGRLAAAFSGIDARSIYLSEYLDGDNWTVPTDPVETDPAILTIPGSIGNYVNGLFSPYQDKLIYFTPNSFGGLYGSRRSNFIFREFSSAVGLKNQFTIQDCDGLLRWLANDTEIYEFDGVNIAKISEDIDDLMSSVDFGFSHRSTITPVGLWANDRYWISVCISSHVNNRVLVYDKNRQWQMWNYQITGAANYNKEPYFCQTSTGIALKYIAKAEQGHTDGGSLYQSYFWTRDFIVGDIDTADTWQELIVFFNNTDSDLNVFYQPDGYSNSQGVDDPLALTLSTGIPTDARTGVYQLRRLKFKAGTVSTTNAVRGNFISFKFVFTGGPVNSTYDGPRLMNANLYYKPDPLPMVDKVNEAQAAAP